MAMKYDIWETQIPYYVLVTWTVCKGTPVLVVKQ